MLSKLVQFVVLSGVIYGACVVIWMMFAKDCEQQRCPAGQKPQWFTPYKSYPQCICQDAPVPR